MYVYLKRKKKKNKEISNGCQVSKFDKCMWFYITKIQDFEIQTLHNLQGQSQHIQCLIFLLNWLKKLIFLRLSGRGDHS